MTQHPELPRRRLQNNKRERCRQDSLSEEYEEEFLRYQGNTPLPPIHRGDVGYDLYCSRTTRIGPMRGGRLQHLLWLLGIEHVRWPQQVSRFVRRDGSSFVRVPTGTSVEMPTGIYGIVLPRSSSNNRGMLVLTGVIDNGYRGPLFAMVHNLTDREIVVKKGDRIAQLVLFPVRVYKTDKVTEFQETTRGHNGFGSTGV